MADNKLYTLDDWVKLDMKRELDQHKKFAKYVRSANKELSIDLAQRIPDEMWLLMYGAWFAHQQREAQKGKKQ